MRNISIIAALMLLTSTCLLSQPLIPTDHGFPGNQPAWNSEQTQVQEYSLKNGFNWWSSYIDMSEDGIGALKNALGSDASLIKNNNSFITYNPSTDLWTGSLSSIDNSTMCLILISSTDSDFQLEGNAVNPADVNIEITPGWNWIGYPCASASNINTALANFSANNNDQIKSQMSFATYSAANGEWIGQLTTLDPGQGYILLSNNTEASSFHYTPSSKDEVIISEAPSTVWKPNPTAFAQNMTIIATISLQGMEVRDDVYEVGVFHGDECRGTTRLFYVEATNSYMAFLTAYGNNGDELQFRLLDQGNNMVYTTQNDQRITYNDNATLGLLDTPYLIEFRDVLNTEEALASMLDIYPNPMSCGQDLYITLPENEANASQVKVQIVNLLGQVVHEESMTGSRCSIHGMASGLYTIRVLSENTPIYNGKLIVK